MTVFPDIIKIIIVEGDTDKPIANIAAQIKLFANHKNDYNFILPLSDERGCITITKSWLSEEIKKERALFVMDYASELDDCKPYIEVSVLDNGALLRSVDAMVLYQEFTGISDDEINKYRIAENSKFSSWNGKVKLEGVQMDINIALLLRN